MLAKWRPKKSSSKTLQTEKSNEDIPRVERGRNKTAELKPNENLVGKLKPPEHLQALLSSQLSSTYFYNFVNKIFSSETLSFWIAVEHYKCKVSENESVAHLYAKEIYETYLKRFSEKEVNLEGEQHSLSIKNPDITTFRALQEKAWQLLVTSDYYKFTTSADYKQYIS